MKGRKPKPTHLKLVTGNPGRRPQKVAPEPKSEAPQPPPELTEDALVEWNRVSAELHGLGLLTGVDRAALAAYAQAYGRWAAAERALAKMAAADSVTGGLLIKTTNGNAIQNPLVGVANKAAAAMVRYAAEFGMTPSARSRIEASPSQRDADQATKYF
jgi:P27 family predicted phage terminase small subunit